MNSSITISDQRRFFEIVAVILTGLGKFVFMDWLNIKFIYISIACVSWIIYIGYRIKENPAIATYWGLSKRHFKQSFFELLPIATLLLIAFYLIGNKNDTNVLNWSILPILLLYPIWGTIQQFIMIGMPEI